MATTVFESPTAVGAKVFTITTTVTNTSGAYTSTINDERVTAAMKAIKLELGTPSVFDDKISVVCNNGSMTISCNSVAGTSTVAVSIIKACEDPTEVTSAEFDVLANRIGSLTNLTTTEKTTVVGAINEVGYTTSTKQDATDNNLSTTAKTVVGAINENASAISSNSQAITNLQSDVATHTISTVADFISLFTENDKVLRVKSTGSASTTLIKHNSRNVILHAWKNGDWIYYNGEDFDGILGTGFIQISTQTATYYELETKSDAPTIITSSQQSAYDAYVVEQFGKTVHVHYERISAVANGTQVLTGLPPMAQIITSTAIGTDNGTLSLSISATIYSDGTMKLFSLSGTGHNIIGIFDVWYTRT